MNRLSITATLASLVLAVACSSKSEPATGSSAASSAPATTTAKAEEGPGLAAPRPPSTGNELPARTAAMSLDDARAIVARAVEQAGQAGKLDCARVVEDLNVALPLAAPEPTPESVPAYQLLARCATETRRWRTLVAASAALLPVDGDAARPAQLVRALAELGEYDHALDAAKRLAEEFPSQEANLLAAATFVYCRAEAWQPCLSTADRVRDVFAKAKVPADSDAALTTRALRAMALIVTGGVAEGLAELDAVVAARPAAAQAFAQLRASAARAQDTGIFVDVVVPPQLPLGVYHLMGKAETGALVTLKLHEHRRERRTLRIEAEVSGVTERSSNTLTLEPGQGVVKFANPPLKLDLDVGAVRGPRPSQLVLRVVEQAAGGERVLIDETVPIEVLPRDYLPLRRKVGADALVPTYGFLGAWVMSNDRAIDAFLAQAKQRAPGRAFVGEQDVTVPQVKALFDTLKARGVSYVMDPNVDAEAAFVQRTRLPAEVLASTNAQCLEGTLLFATLLEAIGIKPIVVVVPGHAFVGWHPVAKDGTRGEPLFVETTMVGNATFEQAVEVAMNRVAHERKVGNFDVGVSQLIDVATLRTQGFVAQPM